MSTPPWFHQYAAAVEAAAALATSEWQMICNLEADALPFDATQSIQLRLRRWQVSKFGFNSDERLALGVIEELGETFSAPDLDEACDGLGDVTVYVGQLAFNNNLTIGPIIDLGRVFQASHLEPLRAAGYLAHTVLKHVQNIRGLGDPATYRTHLVAALGLAIAKATDDVELVHSTDVNVREVYRIVADHVLSRTGSMLPAPSAGPPVVPVDDPRRRAAPFQAQPGPLPCGCAEGRHPNHHNYLEGALERELEETGLGTPCPLGWRQAS